VQDQPEPDVLVALVAEFLRAEILPVTDGATGFQLRVAINALELVGRQLRLAADTDAAERARLVALVGQDDTLEELSRALCQRIAQGAMGLGSSGLAEHLWATTLEKLAVDQPNYASYEREIENIARRNR
jgi:Domain of unknown function (DUF6285)